MITLRQQQLSVKRLDIIEAIKEGQAKHLAAYAEAKADYEAVLLSEFTRIRNQIAAGNFAEVTIHITAPQDHSAEYSDILEMLSYGVEDSLVLDRDAFKAYFKNEWQWSHHFHETASFYKATLAAAAH
jgi:ATP phosphoribosyltransferase